MKQWFNDQLVMVQQVSPIATMGLLMLNLALSVAAMISWRGLSSYTAITITLTVIVAIVWALSFWYTRRLRMYRFNQYAQLKLNQFAINELRPIDCMMYRVVHLPTLRYIERQTGDAVLKNQNDKLEQWLRTGTIPMSEYSEELVNKYQLHDHQQKNTDI